MYRNFKISEEERKQIMNLHESHGYKKPLKEDFDDMSDRVSPYTKFKSPEELLMSINGRLITAVQMKEWSLVEEITMDVHNFVKKMNNDMNIGDQSSVEDDDYDEKQERHYGVED